MGKVRHFMMGVALMLCSGQTLPLWADPVEQLFSNRACPECNLRGQDLSSRALNGANLSTANLRNVDLQNSNLRNANLTEADLRGAKLTDAITLGAVQAGAKFCRTIMPDGKLNNQDCRLLEN